MPHEIKLERLYTSGSAHEGSRVLVDRLWPRGRTRDALALTKWHPDAAPSSSLRRQYHRQQISEASFHACYRIELDERPDTLWPLMKYAREGELILLTASRNIDHSHLPVLRKILLAALAEEDAADREPSSPPCWAHELHKP